MAKVIIKINKDNFSYESTMSISSKEEELQCFFKLEKNLELKYEINDEELEEYESLDEYVKACEIEDIVEEIKKNLQEVKDSVHGCPCYTKDLEFEINDQ